MGQLSCQGFDFVGYENVVVRYFARIGVTNTIGFRTYEHQYNKSNRMIARNRTQILCERSDVILLRMRGEGSTTPLMHNCVLHYKDVLEGNIPAAFYCWMMHYIVIYGPIANMKTRGFPCFVNHVSKFDPVYSCRCSSVCAKILFIEQKASRQSMYRCLVLSWFDRLNRMIFGKCVQNLYFSGAQFLFIQFYTLFPLIIFVYQYV
jgi:hypothetical protein